MMQESELKGFLSHRGPEQQSKPGLGFQLTSCPEGCSERPPPPPAEAPAGD